MFHTNIGHIMHRFWDTSWSKSLRPQIGPVWLCKLPLEWFHTFHILGQDCAALYYYCILSIIVGKWTKPDLSDLENDILNNSIIYISWQLINIIPNKLYAENKEKWPDCFEQIAKKYQNNQIWHFLTLKMTIRAIQPIPIGSPLLGKLHVKI